MLCGQEKSLSMKKVCFRQAHIHINMFTIWANSQHSTTKTPPPDERLIYRKSWDNCFQFEWYFSTIASLVLLCFALILLVNYRFRFAFDFVPFQIENFVENCVRNEEFHTHNHKSRELYSARVRSHITSHMQYVKTWVQNRDLHLMKSYFIQNAPYNYIFSPIFQAQP